MKGKTDAQIITQLQQQNKLLFTPSDFARFFNVKNRNTLYKIMQRLSQRQAITPLKKGHYALTTALNNQLISHYQIANFLYSPSYISLETALSLYSIITGFSYAITSVSPKPTKTLTVQSQEYSYTQLTPHLFWGYQKQDRFLIATPEKSLLDYLYLAYKGLRSTQLDEFDFSQLDQHLFIQYLAQTHKPRLKHFINNQTQALTRLQG
jgi:predicted transcriptional regulator of viral defense system